MILMIILTTWIYLQSTSWSHSQPSIMHFPDESFDWLMHHITNNHKSPTNQSYQSTRIQTYELSRPAGSGRASNQPIISQSIIQSIKQRTNQTTNKSNNQQINQSNSPEYRHLNCPGLQGGVGQDDGSSLPSMQSVDPSQYLGCHYNNEEIIKISKI